MSGIIIQGFLISGLYALVAVGFTMIFSVGRVLNLAYGIYIMLGGYAYYTLAQVLEISKVISLLGAIVVGILFGIITYFGIVKRLQNNPIAVEISTLILAVVMQAVIILIYSPSPRAIWPIIPGISRVHDVIISWNIFFAMMTSWVVLGALLVFVRKTQLGRAIMAVSMDPKGALLSGIDPERSPVFRQSQVKEHTELHLIFSMLITKARLERRQPKPVAQPITPVISATTGRKIA